MDSQSNQPPRGGERPAAKRAGALPGAWIWIVLVAIVVMVLLRGVGDWGTSVIDDYNFFLDQVRRKNVEEVTFKGERIVGKFRKVPEDVRKDEKPLKEKFSLVAPPQALHDESLLRLLEENGVRVKAIEQSNGGWMLFILLAPTVILLVFFWVMLRRARDQFDGGILGNFIKSPARRYEKEKSKVTFKDVANMENAKLELEEIVEFLKSPEKFQRLGGQIPKGILLMGPPGTGKTLVARAVAGEAGVPFFSINGSEFIQMFVGVGASRVRDMFKTAKESSPCILFIDEIDAVGRVRGAGLGGGHDEREQTLNQILSEMDGFQPNESVIVLAATNRPDVLDPALLRPGRFDRHVTVDRPSRKGRVGIFKVHTRNVPLAEDVDLDQLAAGTVGLTGADIRNLVNEAALLATRKEKDRVEMIDFDQARDKVLMGPKREEVLSGREKQMVAYHEAGHALVARLTPGSDPLHKVTIIPRGRSLGSTHQLPDEERHNYGRTYLMGRLAIMLGGREAEAIIFNEGSSGAEDDLKRATELARRMVTHWGMSERIGPVAFRGGEEHPFLGKDILEARRDFSENTAQIIDEEVHRFLSETSAQTRKLLEENRSDLELITEALIEREVLNAEEITTLLSGGELGPVVEIEDETGKKKPVTVSAAESAGDGDEAAEPAPSGVEQASTPGESS